MYVMYAHGNNWTVEYEFRKFSKIFAKTGLEFVLCNEKNDGMQIHIYDLFYRRASIFFSLDYNNNDTIRSKLHFSDHFENSIFFSQRLSQKKNFIIESFRVWIKVIQSVHLYHGSNILFFFKREIKLQTSPRGGECGTSKNTVQYTHIHTVFSVLNNLTCWKARKIEILINNCICIWIDRRRWLVMAMMLFCCIFTICETIFYI